MVLASTCSTPKNFGFVRDVRLESDFIQIVSVERKSVVTKFTALKPLSHSEVLHGMVLVASTRGFSFCVICLPPVSL